MLRIYDSNDFSLLHVVSTYKPTVVAADREGHWLASGGKDGVVRLWKWDGEPGAIGQHHKSEVWCLAWSPDGEILASGPQSGDDTIRLWRLDDNDPLVLPNPGITESLAWSPDGSSLASGGSRGVICIWNPKDGAKIAEYAKVQGSIMGLAWSPDGKQLASTHKDSPNANLWIWDVTSGESIASGKCAGSWPNCLDWHPKSGLAAAAQDGYIALIDPSKATLVSQSPQVGPLACACWSPNGTRIADSRGRLFQVEDGKFKSLQPAWSEINVEPIEEGETSGTRVSWKDGRSATVWADGRIEGEEELVERELACVIEGSDGRLELMRPSEFRQRVEGVDDNDRRVAEWVLGRGGEVYVCLEGEEPRWEYEPSGFVGYPWSYWASSVKQLPGERFSLFGLHTKKASGDEIKRLAHCRRLECLVLLDMTELSFKGMKRLKYLRLCGSRIGDEGLATLVDASQLLRLDLSQTDVTNKGLSYLEQLEALRGLWLSDTPISDEGLAHLAGLSNLEALWLGDTDVSGAGVVYLERCQNLKYLNLEGIAPNPGLESLRVPRSVRILSLKDGQITDDDLEHLCASPFLKTVDLRGTAVTAEGVTKLRRALAECEVFSDFDVDQFQALRNGWTVSDLVNLDRTASSSNKEKEAAISSDGLTLFSSSDRPGGQGGDDLWMSSRNSTNDPFGEPVNLGPIVNSEDKDYAPAISSDGLTLLFSSTRPNRSDHQANYDLWMCTRKSTSEQFGTPVNLGQTVNSDKHDREPTISSDGLTLVFSSGRLDGRGSMDLWMCTRKSLGDPFGKPVNLGPTVNSSELESWPTLSPDGNTLFFNSRRPGGQGKSDLWKVQIHRPEE